MKKLKSSNIIVSIVTCALCLLILIGIILNTSVIYVKADTNNSTTDNMNNADEGATTEVVSYNEVFKYYYTKVINSVPNNLFNLDLDDFIDLYYNQSRTINEFSNYIIENGLLSEDLIDESQIDFDSAIQPMNTIVEMISPDENYILGSYIGDENNTAGVYFKRKPINEAFNYSKIYNGDIIYESASKSPANHAAFIYKYNQPSDFGNYVQTIEAVAGGVQYGFLDDERMTRFGVSVYRIYRANELGVVAKARTFIKDQIGKDYSTDFIVTHTDYNTEKWYCSELIFAGYYYGGMDICSNRDMQFEPESMFCFPMYLTKGLLSMPIILDTDYLILSIDGFSSSGVWNKQYWEIRITNLNDNEVTVLYNEKMCNTTDARDWSGLNDPKTVVIDEHSSKTVKIYQNYFATTVAASFVSGDYRYITYGMDLSKVDFSISLSNNKIAL